ncbi:MAG: tRNA N6-adenosine threonylcarbamoyltransferase [Parcubacteria group bacterium Athens0714_26]|nr:MAG: tRNA N6-adenosine threonylcarbamoyltransferase [Parcubacteria group bacterium Athens1014_26]TSD03816.1 MAG: tRNA N6-adenosine threonylcarbamoyltransferase [Parcubacteria group bacterium Athens0714_26]
MKPSVILAIETSCDDTSIALVKCQGGIKNPRFEVLKSVVSSQIAVHRPFGGVVPNLAKREHIKNLPIIWKQFAKSHPPSTINQIAVTVGPGLEPALWTGITFAQELSEKIKKPLMGVNHLEGHLYSDLLSTSKITEIKFPATALIVSGGHTILLNMKNLNHWTKLGETLDDAAGEAFDKVAKMLGLPYPGGPEIDKLAVKGNPNAIKFPRPLLNPQPNKNKQNKYNFSFSGLKTSVLYYLRKYENNENTKQEKNIQQSAFRTFVPVLNFVNKADVAASFQQAATDVLVQKTVRAAKEFESKTIMLSGGVSANKLLRNTLKQKSEELKINFLAPEFEFITDNAAMIAAAAYINLLSKKKKLKIEARSDLTV